MTARPDYPLLTADQFLEFSFGDRKAELDQGVIRVLDGVTVWHATIQGNLLVALANRLKGSGFRPYGSLMPIRTGERSVRVADLAVFPKRDEPEYDDCTAFDDPRVVFEIQHGASPRTNIERKIEEYKRLSSLDTLVLVDANTECLRVTQRIGPGNWEEEAFVAAYDVPLPSLGIVVSHAGIFARD